MKRTTQYFLIALIGALLIGAGSIQAQTTTDVLEDQKIGNARYLHWDGIAIDSAETIWSQAFTIGWNDDMPFGLTADSSFARSPLNYGYDFATADSINVTVTWFVSFDNVNWISGDVLFTATTATATKGQADLNDVKAPYHKIKLVNNAGSSANTAFYLGLYLAAGDAR